MRRSGTVALVAFALTVGAVPPAANAAGDDRPGTIERATVERATVRDAASTAKTTARMKVTKSPARTVTSPFPLTITRQQPVLVGSTAKNRKKIRTWAKKFFAAEKKRVISARSSCDASAETGRLTVSNTTATVYAKRYASVAMTISSYGGCDFTYSTKVRSITLDLRTGKTVKLKKFVAPKALVTRLAITSTMNSHKSTKSCAAGMSPSSLPQHDAWSLSAKGVRFWYEPNSTWGPACWVMAATVPWAELATPKQLKGKKFVRVYTNGLWKDPQSGRHFGEYVLLGVRGRQVVTSYAAVASEMFCSAGLRRGKKVISYDTAWAERYTTKLKGTKAKPKLALEGYHEASAKELKQLDAEVDLDPFTSCGVS